MAAPRRAHLYLPGGGSSKPRRSASADAADRAKAHEHAVALTERAAASQSAGPAAVVSALSVRTAYDVVSLATTEQLGMVNASYTVECWVRLDSAADDCGDDDSGGKFSTQPDRPILAVNENGLNAFQGFHLLVRDGYSYLGHYGSDTRGAQVEACVWTHLCFRFCNETKTQSILHNSRLVAVSHNHRALESSCALVLGCYADDSRLLYGLISDLRVWSGVVRTERDVHRCMRLPFLGFHTVPRAIATPAAAGAAAAAAAAAGDGKSAAPGPPGAAATVASATPAAAGAGAGAMPAAAASRVALPAAATDAAAATAPAPASPPLTQIVAAAQAGVDVPSASWSFARSLCDSVSRTVLPIPARIMGKAKYVLTTVGLYNNERGIGRRAAGAEITAAVAAAAADAKGVDTKDAAAFAALLQGLADKPAAEVAAAVLAPFGPESTAADSRGTAAVTIDAQRALEPLHTRGVAHHRLAFLMGLHKRLGGSEACRMGGPAFRRHEMFDKNVCRDILAFTDTSFSPFAVCPPRNDDQRYALRVGTKGGLALDGTSADFGFVNASYTVEAWIRIDRLVNSDCSLLSMGEDGGEGNGLHLVVRHRKPYFGHYGDDSSAEADKWEIKEGVWTHLAFAFDKDKGTQTVIFNGAEANVSTGHRVLSKPVKLFIGWYGGVGSSPLRGAMAQLRIWNSALPAAQVATRMHISFSASDAKHHALPAGLLASWAFDGDRRDVVSGRDRCRGSPLSDVGTALLWSTEAKAASDAAAARSQAAQSAKQQTIDPARIPGLREQEPTNYKPDRASRFVTMPLLSVLRQNPGAAAAGAGAVAAAAVKK